jgi:hypothetical protein
MASEYSHNFVFGGNDMTLPRQQYDSDATAIYQAGLVKARLNEEFMCIIAVDACDTLYDAMTLWGVELPEHICKEVHTDQEFEDWKCTLKGPEQIFNDFNLVEIGGFRHGFTLMSCGSCTPAEHGEPIWLHSWCPKPRHGVSVSTVYGSPPNSAKDRFYLMLDVHGGVLRVYPAPALTGGLGIGMVLLQPSPFQKS